VVSHPTHRACARSTDKNVAACDAIVRNDVATPKSAVTPAVTPAGYGPTQLVSAYKLSTTGGAGRTVAIVDAYDLPTAESDLATYRSQFGLSPCTTANGCFRKVNQTGGSTPPASDPGWGQEIALDLDMVSAACPNCHILLVEANSASFADLGTAVNRAVTMGASAVSNSYGGGDSASDTTYDSSYYNHPGVVVTASSGDSGYIAEYPATSQYVTAVGGTSLVTATNTRGWSETAWSGAGSGCSAYEAKPSWQTTTTGCSTRAEADVSAVADPNTGVAVYDSTPNSGQSGWLVFGGTSVASPFIAGVYMLAGAPAAGTYPASYPWAHTSNLFDVTSGSNGTCSPSQLCTARIGWDGPTGWGTPNGSAAFSSGSGGGNTVTVTNPGTQNSAVGASVSLRITGTDSGGLTLTYSATGLPTGTSISSGGRITGTTTTAGAYRVQVTGQDSTGASDTVAFWWYVGDDFSITVTPTNGTVPLGSSTTATVTTAVTFGSAQTITLSATNVPSGVTVSFSPAQVTSGGSATMTITVSPSAAVGNFPIRVTGTGTAITHTRDYQLTVPCAGGGQLLGNPGFETGTLDPWTGSAGAVVQADSVSTPAHSGSWSAGLVDDGTPVTVTLSQTVTIPAGCSSYTLSFWEMSTVRNADQLTVTLNGGPLQGFRPDTSYRQRSYNLSRWAGQTVTVGFTSTMRLAEETLIDDAALIAS
jgi:hypothetical protein